MAIASDLVIEHINNVSSLLSIADRGACRSHDAMLTNAGREHDGIQTTKRGGHYQWKYFRSFFQIQRLREQTDSGRYSS